MKIFGYIMVVGFNGGLNPREKVITFWAMIEHGPLMKKQVKRSGLNNSVLVQWCSKREDLSYFSLLRCFQHKPGSTSLSTWMFGYQVVGKPEVILHLQVLSRS